MNPYSNYINMHGHALRQEKHDPQLDQLEKMALPDQTAAIQMPVTGPLSMDRTHMQFGLVKLLNTYLPCVIRSGEKYVPLRTLPIKQDFLDPSLCINIERFNLTKEEAYLISKINYPHSDSVSDQDEIILLRVATEMCEFFNFCDSKLQRQCISRDKRCGFVRLFPEGSFLPFVRCNSKHYVPLFYLTEYVGCLDEVSVEITGWDLTYLILLCKVHNTVESTQNPRSIRVIDLETVKQKFFPDATIEEMWPMDGKIEALIEKFISSRNHTDVVNIPQREVVNKLPGAQLKATRRLVNTTFNLGRYSWINSTAQCGMPQYKYSVRYRPY